MKAGPIFIEQSPERRALLLNRKRTNTDPQVQIGAQLISDWAAGAA